MVALTVNDSGGGIIQGLNQLIAQRDSFIGGILNVSCCFRADDKAG